MGKSLQESTKEHEHDTELTKTVHDELIELSHREEHDDQIENDVEDSCTPSKGVNVDALSMVLTIPMFPSNADGNTLQRN